MHGTVSLSMRLTSTHCAHQGCICQGGQRGWTPLHATADSLDTVKNCFFCLGVHFNPPYSLLMLHFVSGSVLTINARNYFGNLLFANYYTAVYSFVTATNFTWYASICRNTPNGHLIPFPVWSVCLPNSDPPLKFHKYSRPTQPFILLGSINE